VCRRDFGLDPVGEGEENVGPADDLALFGGPGLEGIVGLPLNVLILTAPKNTLLTCASTT